MFGTVISSPGFRYLKTPASKSVSLCSASTSSASNSPSVELIKKETRRILI